VEGDRPFGGAVHEQGHHLGDGEHRQQGDHVGESLVEPGLVRGRRVGVPLPQPVEQGVRRLVGDHVV
jgi:hypothetical protein